MDRRPTVHPSDSASATGRRRGAPTTTEAVGLPVGAPAARPRRAKRWMLGPVLALGAVAFLTSCKADPVFAVNTTIDGRDANPADNVCEMTVGLRDCSLRAAIDQSNATAGPVTITVPSGTYTLAPGAVDDTNVAGDLDVNTVAHSVTIRAASPGARIDAGRNEAAMDIHRGRVQLNQVSLTNASGPAT